MRLARFAGVSGLLAIACALAACSGTGSPPVPKVGNTGAGEKPAAVAQAVPSSALDSDIMALNPIAFYKLDEVGSKTAADSSGNNYTLTNTTPTSITQGVAGLVPDGGTAYTFTAATSSVHGVGASLSPTTTSTVVAFLNGTFAPVGIHTVACFPYTKCLMVASGHLGFTSQGYAPAPRTGYQLTSVTMQNNTTHLLVLEMLGTGNCLASVDGSPLTSIGAGCGTNTFGATPKWQIGKDVYSGVGNNGFVGTYDDIAAFYGASAALTQTQICQLAYDGGVAAASCPTPTAPPTPSVADGTVYVVDSKANSTSNPNNLQDIVSFAPGNLSGPPSADITTMNFGSYQSYGGVTLDASGNLWTDNLTPSILEFAPNATGNVTPIRNITPANGTSQDYWGIAVDSSGEIYAAGTAFLNVGQGQIDVYAANASGVSTPVRSFTGPEMAGGRKLVIDASGNVWTAGGTVLAEYAANASGTVSPMLSMLVPRAQGGAQLAGCPTTWPVQPGGMAFDAQGNLLVATYSTANGGAILKFAPPFTGCPTAYLNTLNEATDVAMDDKGNLYTIVDGGVNQVDIYPESAMVPGYPSDWSTVTPVSPSSSIVGTSTNLAGGVSIAVWNSGPVSIPEAKVKAAKH